jgi:ABC-type phosphate transport system substrate-binding protein
MMRNSHVAAAVAAALALGSYTAAEAFPTPAQAAGVPATNAIYIAGSSAAANAVINYIESTVCGNTGYSVFTTPTSSVGLPDFRAVSCNTATGQIGNGALTTFWYRPEGGSVVGVFPVLNNVAIKQLGIATANCTTSATTQATAAYVCNGVAGTTPGNGTNDSFGPAGVISHTVDIGVSDLEPGAFANPAFGSIPAWAGGGNNDPVSNGIYDAGFTGPDISVSAAEAHANVSFDQVFGFVVSANLHTAGVTDLPKSQIANLYAGNVTNWNQVSLANNTAVAVNASPVICNRELGSGTRAETDIFLFGDGCINGSAALPELAGSTLGTAVQPTDNFQTIAELDCVNKQSNAIGYVSIDNFAKTAANASSSFPNTWPITIDGVSAVPATYTTGTNGGFGAAQAAVGAYDDWYEASLQKNPSASAVGANFYTNYLVPALQSLNANVGSSYQVMAIPGTAGNTATVPLAVGAHNVYVADFTRSGNSCYVPAP